MVERTTRCSSGCKKFQHTGISPELEENLDLMFSIVVATGDLACTPNSRNFGKESVDEHDLSSEDATHDVEELPNSIGPSKKRKDVGSKKMTKKKTMSSTMDEIAQASRIIGHCMIDPPRIKISLSLHTIPEAIEELEKYTEVMEDSNYAFYDYCTMFPREKHNRETFTSIRADQRLKWPKTRYEQKSE